MLVAPVRRSAIVFGRIIGGVTTSLIQATLILMVSFLLGFRISSLPSLFLAFLFMILIGIGFIGFGIAIASKMEDVHGFSLIIQLIIFPTFFLSGALLPTSGFPKWLKAVIYLNTLSYGVDGLRASLSGFSQFPLLFDLGVLLVFDLVMIALASWLFSKTEV